MSNFKLFLAAGLLIGLALAVLVSPFASGSPDGLESVAISEGFAATAEGSAVDTPLADYGVRGVEDERMATGVAGLVGTLLTFGVGTGLFALLRTLRPAGESPESAPESVPAAN